MGLFMFVAAAVMLLAGHAFMIPTLNWCGRNMRGWLWEPDWGGGVGVWAE